MAWPEAMSNSLNPMGVLEINVSEDRLAEPEAMRHSLNPMGVLEINVSEDRPIGPA